MSFVRRIPRILHAWLALSLLLAPLVPGHVMAAPDAMAVPAAAGPHDTDGHHAHASHDPVAMGQPGCDGTQACPGVCCAACGHCPALSVPLAERLSGHRPALSPREPLLHSFAVPLLRERPPRRFIA